MFNLIVYVQLLDGPSENEGRLEYFTEAGWTSVCDNNFNDINAQVVCAEIGLDGGLSIGGGLYGPGPSGIFMSEIDCNGTEEKLSYCPTGVLNTCTHDEDISVVCGMRYLLNYILSY